MVPKVKCPNCANVSPIPERLLGKTVRCKRCDKQFVAKAVESRDGVAEVVPPPLDVVAQRVADPGAGPAAPNPKAAAKYAAAIRTPRPLITRIRILHPGARNWRR